MTSGGSAVAAHDKDTVARAYRKVVENEKLTARERAALKRFEREREERLRWQYYAEIPQKHWRQMSGRQSKILNEQAERYGIPFGGATIGLPAVVRALHDFLADNAQRLARDEEALPGGLGPLDRYREERAALARLDRLEREGSMLPRDLVRESMGRIAAILRSAGDTLQRTYGQDAAQVLSEALDDAQLEIDQTFAFDGAMIDPEEELQ